VNRSAHPAIESQNPEADKALDSEPSRVYVRRGSAREEMDMPRVDEEIVINRPPEEVFDFVTTPENDLRWVSTAVERQRESEGAIGVGSKIKAIDKFLGRRIESTLEVTGHEPPTRSTIELRGQITAHGTYALEPAGSGTRFHWALEADPGLGGLFLGRVTDPLVTWVFRRRVQGDLRRLKNVLESSNGGAG
jgi:carbon monoxide dehydrogenase subunit G